MAYPYDLAVRLLYGCGLRLFECLKLRMNDFSLDAGILTIHDGKGKKDRTVPLPDSMMPEIRKQFESVFELRQKDLVSGYAGVFMMGLLDENTKTPRRNSSGSGSFRPLRLRPCRKAEKGNATIFTKGTFKGPSKRRREKRGFTSASRPYVSAQFRHPLAASQLRHTNHSGSVGTRRYQDHHDLHPRH